MSSSSLTVKEFDGTLVGMADRFQDLPMPVLLREARDAYTTSIRRALAEGGFDDMPRAGVRVIGRIARGGLTVQEVGGAYGASKQAASQLVDNLVATGYVARAAASDDRRKVEVQLTPRGAAAAAVVAGAIDGVDAALHEVLPAADLYQARRVLGVLAALRYGEDPAPELA